MRNRTREETIEIETEIIKIYHEPHETEICGTCGKPLNNLEKVYTETSETILFFEPKNVHIIIPYYFCSEECRKSLAGYIQIEKQQIAKAIETQNKNLKKSE